MNSKIKSFTFSAIANSKSPRTPDATLLRVASVPDKARDGWNQIRFSIHNRIINAELWPKGAIINMQVQEDDAGRRIGVLYVDEVGRMLSTTEKSNRSYLVFSVPYECMPLMNGAALEVECDAEGKIAFVFPNPSNETAELPLETEVTETASDEA